LRVEQEPVQRRAGDASRPGELVGGTAARRCSEYRDAAFAVRVGERAQRGGLAGTGDADDADDPGAAARGVEDEVALLVGERLLVDQSAEQHLSVWARRIRVASAERKVDCLALDLEQLAAREPRRPARRPALLDQLDAREARELAGGLEDVVDRRAIRHGAGYRPDELGHRERRLPRREAVLREQASGQLVDLDTSADAPLLRGKVLELAAAEAVLGGARLPPLAKAAQVDRLLRLAGSECGDSGGGEALGAECLHVLDERSPAAGERAHRLLRDACQFAHALYGLGPLQPQPVRERVAEVGFVEVAGGEPVRLQDRLAVERSPLAVRAPGHVGDDHVRVQVRVLRPRGAVPKRRRHEPVPVLADPPALAATDDARLAFQVGERRLPGLLVRLADLPAASARRR
jgi:hypothetical protein